MRQSYSEEILLCKNFPYAAFLFPYLLLNLHYFLLSYFPFIFLFVPVHKPHKFLILLFPLSKIFSFWLEFR